MKLVFVVNKMDIGGPQKVIAFLANHLISCRHQVSIITYSAKKPNLHLETGINLISMRYEASEQNAKNIITKRINQLPLLLHLRQTIQAINPDVLCVFTISVLRMVEKAVAGLNYPIVSSERGNPYTYSRRFLNVAGKAYGRCDTVVFQTEKARECFDLPNGTVIPNPAIKRAEGFQSEASGIENLILSIGRLEPEKGFDFLIDCITDVREIVDCHLRIYGSGSMKNELERLIEERHLEDTVELCGERSNVFDLNADASVYVLPSYTEGMPNVLIEAMIAGIPCIATDCSSGGPRRLLDNGECGMLVEVGNKEQVVNAIVDLLNDKEKANKFIQNSHRVIEELSPDKVFQKWMSIFEKYEHYG